MGYRGWDVVVAAVGSEENWRLAQRDGAHYGRWFRTEALWFTDHRGLIRRLRRGIIPVVHLHADPGWVDEDQLLGACWNAWTTLLIRARFGPPPAPTPTEDWPWQIYLPGPETPPGLIHRLAADMPIESAWKEVLGDPRRLKFGFGGISVGPGNRPKLYRWR